MHLLHFIVRRCTRRSHRHSSSRAPYRQLTPPRSLPPFSMEEGDILGLITELQRAKVNWDACDKLGRSALHLAAHCRLEAVVGILGKVRGAADRSHCKELTACARAGSS
jgi:hypothetical protein